jgi:hypothetical protein
MKIHELKCVEPYFTDIITGMKSFEVRKNDRDFQVGDILHLRSCHKNIIHNFDAHYVVANSEITYTEPGLDKSGYPLVIECLLKITYILKDYSEALKPGYVILGIEKIYYD